MARLVLSRPKFEEFFFSLKLKQLGFWVLGFFYNLNGFGFFYKAFLQIFFGGVFFVKILFLWLFFCQKHGDVVFKNENLRKWFPGVRKNLTILCGTFSQRIVNSAELDTCGYFRFFYNEYCSFFIFYEMKPTRGKLF